MQIEKNKSQIEIPKEYTERVMVRFYFASQKLLPIGIRKLDRNDEEIRIRQEAAARKLTTAEFADRVRKGRVDTGEQREHKNVDPTDFWDSLKKNFQIADIHSVEQENGKTVVVVTFAKDPLLSGGRLGSVKPEIVKAIEQTFIYPAKWGSVWHWVNPDKTETLNCIARQEKPKNLIEQV
ncbi:MAG: hypothetical protein Q7T34_00200 [Candidatus Parcubacteria bacterium]|nr:hypothetical protein [Candidatus Parcubacteria bacterium]